jgi:hypothetical protein
MRRVAYWGCIVLVPLLAQTLQAETIHSTWTGVDMDRWYDAGHWNPPRIPNNSGGTTYAVTIATESSVTIDFGPDPLASGPDQPNSGPGPQGTIIDQLHCTGSVALWIGERLLTLADPNGLVNGGRLQIDGEGVKHRIQGNVTNQATGLLQVEHMTEIRGRVTNQGQMMIVPGSDLDTDSLTNSGTLLIIHAVGSTEGDLTNTQEGTIRASGVLYVGSTLTNGGTFQACGSLALETGGRLINTGVLKNSPLASLSIGYFLGMSQDVNNLGTIEVNTGGGIAVDGPLVNEPNAAIVLRDGTLVASTITQSAGASFQGCGTITGNLTLAPGAQVQFTGPTRLVGNLEIGAGATLEIGNGPLYVFGAVHNQGTIELKNGSGQLIPQTSVTGEGIVH